jgi:cellulose synthase/poly-beta-1,6-N-acetylglucosamine synthase-like glycosyltransferase
MNAGIEWLVAIWAAAGIAAGIASLPGTVELFILTLGAALPKSSKPPLQQFTGRWRLAVLVPAHNEEATIHDCVQSLQRASRGDFDIQIVVVADNCQDRTGEVAARAGARVLLRRDPDLRGKGYALDFAFKTLLSEGFDAFLIVDADSEVSNNFFLEAAGRLRSGADAVQCRYLVKNASESIRTRLMSLAFRAFNVLRARGRDRLGLSCGICGNGFGMRRETLETVPYLASSVVEDLEYHLSLVRSVKRVHFVDTATVFSEMPTAGKGVATQRARWEGGRFRIARKKAPGLIADVLRGRVRSLEPLMDLLLLPLGFHVVLLILAAFSPWAPARLTGFGGLLIVFVHLMAAITMSGGDWRDAMALLASPYYILWKLLQIPLLIRSSRANTAWIRTERSRRVR